MFIAKEALQNELAKILKQVDKMNLEKDEMARIIKQTHVKTMDQERMIT